ncbi:MAG: hypothetical protein M1378_11655 [Bacteroidetes bacterium]|nr:hypothetical protein [Bacteroidota bacterium]
MKTKKTAIRKISLPRQLRFDLDSSGVVTLVCENGDGCRNNESCPGCNAQMQRKGACWTCGRCGYKSCGGE